MSFNCDINLAPAMMVESIDDKINNIITPAYLDKSLTKYKIFNKPEQLVTKITDTVARVTMFSSKYVGIDEFTNLKYNEDNYIVYNEDIDQDLDNEELQKIREGYLKNDKIIGASSFVNYSYGIIIYHSSNQILFNYAIIEFMLQNYSIPVEFLNLDKFNIYKFKRTNGDINKGLIKDNSSLRISKRLDKIVINVKFDPNIDIDNDIESFYSSYSFLEKSIPLRELMEINDINEIKINVPNYYNDYTYSLEHNLIKCPCDIDDKLLQMINLHYNYQANQHLEKYKLQFIKEKFNISMEDSLSFVISL